MEETEAVFVQKQYISGNEKAANMCYYREASLAQSSRVEPTCLCPPTSLGASPAAPLQMLQRGAHLFFGTLGFLWD